MYDVAIIRGDGIGPELCDATASVIESSGVSICWHEAPMGKAASDTLGHALPLESLDTVRKYKLAIKAPLIAEKLSGGITVEDEKGSRHYPSVNNAIRRELFTYANVRPVIGFDCVSGKYKDMNLVIVREVSEGIYKGIEKEVDANTGHTIKVTTREGSNRIGKFAFELAQKMGRKKVTACHKANVLHKTDGLFLKCLRELAPQYSDITFDDLMIDAACYHVIKTPGIFDVAVLPNQYGDIFSDVTAGLIGSMGLAPGANIGDEYSFFEASHGAAPDIAGKGIVNPISLILSGAMLLEHIGEKEASDRIKNAVKTTLLETQFHTPDLGGKATTKEITEAICQNVQNE
ncbi:MAG: isocitrate/isopropylmalate dehydrogenase family protein [Fibrobacteria bacterium]|nr:isocitrate/isopropylmalate dehydrogenase family protein [Fibrobacteria bacterium]